MPTHLHKNDQSSCRSFSNPDETRPFEDKGQLKVINFPDGTSIGQGIFEPGWKWSTHVKPLADTESCEADHHGYCISGNMVVQMNDGEKIEIHPGDVFSIPPGHDAWVIGNEKCVLLDVTGYKEYAVKKKDIAA